MRRDEFPIIEEYTKDKIDATLEGIKEDVINIADGKQNIKVRSVLRIIDKYKEQTNDKS